MRRLLLTLALLAWGTTAQAQVAYETVLTPTSVGWAADAGPVTATTSFNAGTGSNRVLYVVYCWGGNTDRDFTGVTYNSVAMTSLGAKVSVGTYHGQLWALANPASGTNDIIGTQEADDGGSGGLISALVVNTADTAGTPWDGYASNSGNGSTASIVSSVTVSSAANDRVVVAHCQSNGDNNIAAAPTNYTERAEANNGTGQTISIGDADGAGTVATSATWDNGTYNVNWIALGVNTNATGGGGGGGSGPCLLLLLGAGKCG